MSGEIDLLYCLPHTSLAAAAQGAELVFLASFINRVQFRIVASHEIQKIDQLKGKLLAVSRLHDVAHFYFRLALKSFGINPEKDVQFIAIGGQHDRMLALKSGRVAATVLGPTQAGMMEKIGFKTVLDLETFGLPVVGNVLAAKRNSTRDRRPALIQFLKGMLAGMERIPDDPETSKKVLAKYLRLKDRDFIEENYRLNSVEYLKQAPFLSVEGLRYIIDSLLPTLPAAKNLKAEALIDHSLLEDALKEMK
jgi:ABC-type nitrate/sulfonate/bicarbonate transport system substrate-binding protein